MGEGLRLTGGVTPGLDPGVHHFFAQELPYKMDCQVKPGKDTEFVARARASSYLQQDIHQPRRLIDPRVVAGVLRHERAPGLVCIAAGNPACRPPADHTRCAARRWAAAR